jgi:hypothetical protein
VLERLGKHKDAPDKISECEELSHQGMASKKDKAKLEQREARIIKKVS